MKKRLFIAIWIMAVIAFCLLPLLVMAGPKERVAIAEAIVWANQNARPALPSDTFQSKPPVENTPTPLTKWELEAKRAEQVVELLGRIAECQQDLDAATRRIVVMKLASGAADRGSSHLLASPIPNPGPAGVSSMRLEVPESTQPMSMPAPRAQLVVEFTDYCLPCQRYKKDIKSKLSPLGWDIGEGEDAQIRFMKGRDRTAYPYTTLYQNGIEINHWVGYQDTTTISQPLRKAWDEATEPVKAIGSANCSAGTIHARDGIQKFRSYLRQYIGEGNSVIVLWDRSEATLNLFAAKDFILKDLIGRQGRLQVNAPKAIGLPVTSMATSYELVGDQIFLDPERFGLELKMFQTATGYSAAAPSQMFILDDALFIYSVVQLGQAIYGLLHPSADLVLPDQIAATTVLSGDTITITFDKPPSICLKWLFTFNLAVKKVVITDSLIHCEFSGSRFIKSRDFEVK